MLSKLRFLTEIIIFNCLGFLIAGYIFFVLTFYIAPLATGIQMDSDKYFVQASARLQDRTTHIAVERPGIDENTTTLTESIIGEIDKAADNLIKWINQ